MISAFSLPFTLQPTPVWLPSPFLQRKWSWQSLRLCCQSQWTSICSHVTQLPNRISTQLTILRSWFSEYCSYLVFLLPLGCLSQAVLLVLHPLPLSRCRSALGLSPWPSFPLYTLPGWFHPSHGFKQYVNAEEPLFYNPSPDDSCDFSHSYMQLPTWHFHIFNRLLKFIVPN